MKRKVISITVAALLLGSSIGFAAATSPLIGAKVEGIFTVKKANGKKIADAVVINGTAYAPVRAVSEAAGVNLTVEGKTITMEDATTTTSAVNQTGQPETVNLQAERERLEALIEKKTAAAAELKRSSIDFYDALIAESPNSTTIPQWEAAKKKYNAILDQLNADIATLNQQLTDLDAQIAASQK